MGIKLPDPKKASKQNPELGPIVTAINTLLADEELQRNTLDTDDARHKKTIKFPVPSANVEGEAYLWRHVGLHLEVVVCNSTLVEALVKIYQPLLRVIHFNENGIMFEIED